MKRIVFATHNNHKLEEVRAILKSNATIIGLDDIGCSEEIAEEGDTLEANALAKARYVFDKYHMPCFADDTGLEVEALGGRPGVYSARYAGTPPDSSANIQKLLSEMNGITNRKAQFRTVIAYMEQDQVVFFEGIITGRIADSPSGANGFGYDPIFIPDGYDTCFADMSTALKNTISHRALAVQKLTDFFSEKEK